MKVISYFYKFRVFLPRRFQISMRRMIAALKRIIHRKTWPINPKAAKPPENWKGWPDKKNFAFVLTHDVETATGHSRCMRLMNLELRMGFRSSFNFVLEDYHVSERLRHRLEKEGFEVGIHGLTHDGSESSSHQPLFE
jgi:hypothetical protein